MMPNNDFDAIDALKSAASNLVKCRLAFTRLKAENEALTRRLLASESETIALQRNEIARLTRQLKGAQTRIRNMTLQRIRDLQAWRQGGPPAATLTRQQYNMLRRVFHPDGEAGVSADRNRLLTQAFQIFNDLHIEVIEP